MQTLDGFRHALADRYRVDREIGRGGMATVYLAHDLRHDRDVAIKVLHEDLGATLGPERFLAEIKTTARLQHPHILPLLDSGDAGGLLFYVMPYVEGETLRDRLARETQLPIEDAVRIAREVADALSFAHGHGIIHRDIKPENILLQGGHAVVADFGIALAVQQAGGARLTQTGLSLGTPQYMSPEQAMGEKTIGPAADIYALGAVTYEMLTGEPPFTGATVQSIVAKVLSDRVTPPSMVRDTVPPPVEAAVLRALARLPADRHATARDFSTALALTGVGTTGPDGEIAAASRRSARNAWRRRVRDPLVWVPLAISLASIAGLLAVWRRAPAVVPGLPVRFVLSVADSEPVLNQFPWPAAISPDGSMVVYVAQRPSNTQFYLHRTDALEARAIPGTVSATQPIFSPDGEWIAFETLYNEANRPGALRKARIDGSDLTTLASARANNGADWTTRDEIILGSEGDSLRGLTRVSAAGGALRLVTHPDTANGELDHLWPIALEDGRTVAFVVWRGSLASSELAMTSLDDGRVRKLGLKGIRPLAVLGDQLVYLQTDGVVMAVRIDERKMRATAPAKPVLEGITVQESNGNSGVFVSRGGALVQTARARGRLVWREAGAKSQPLSDDVSTFRFPRLSPDGRRVVVQAGDGARSDIWLYDVATGASSRITSSGNATAPAWSKDGLDLFYVAPTAGNRSAIWRTRADGSGRAAIVFETPDLVLQVRATADGRALVLELLHDNNNDISVVELGANPVAKHYVSTPALETQPTPSPDGRLLAYVSDEGGRYEVYLDKFPAAGTRLQLSANGGTSPRWSADGTKVFYREGTRLMAATISLAPSVRVLGRTQVDVDVSEEFDVARDGVRYLAMESPLSGARLIVTTNWLSELRKRIATGGGK